MIVKYRTPLIDLLIFIDTNGNMAQLVEQLTVNQWVTGSSPVIPAICWCGSTVEQLTCNQQVVGSIPIASSILWPLGQAVKTPPFHGGNRGSIPLWVTNSRDYSSAGRASALQAEGHRFDPCCFHHHTAQ